MFGVDTKSAPYEESKKRIGVKEQAALEATSFYLKRTRLKQRAIFCFVY